MALIPKNLKELKMHLKDPLYKNSYFIMLTSGSVSVFGFVFWIIVARLYTPNDVGVATVIVSMSQLIGVFSILGLNHSLIRFYTTRDDRIEMINSSMTIVGLISMIFIVIFLIGLQFWSPALIVIRENLLLLFSFVLLTIMYSIFTLQGNIFIAARHAQYSFFQNFIYNILRIPLPIFFVTFGILGIISSWTIATIIAFSIGSVWFIPKILHGYKPVPKINKNILKEIMPYSFGNYIAGILGPLPIQIMPLIIVHILSVDSAAYFYVAWSVATVFSMISTSVTTSLFAEGSQNQEEMFRLNISKSVKFIFLLLIPATILLFIFGDKILMLFGQTYSDNATQLLLFFIIGCIPQALNQLYITIKRVQIKIKPIIYVNGFTAAFIIFGSYLFIKITGLIGIGIAWILGQGIVSIVIVFFSIINKKSSN